MNEQTIREIVEKLEKAFEKVEEVKKELIEIGKMLTD